MVYVTAGAGHRRAAEAVARAISAALPGARVDCHDLLTDVPAWLRRAYPGTYYFLVRHLAALWGTAFEVLDHPLACALVQPLRRAWNLVMARRFIRRLRREPPALIVTTHFFPTDVVNACKAAGWVRTPLAVVVTDLQPHRFWLAAAADAYVCGTPEGARVLERRGIRRERIHVLGIPIASGFQAAFDRQRLLELFDLDPSRQVVLVTSGGSTVGPFEAVVEALLALEADFPGRVQLLVVCGDDPGTVRRLSARARAAAMPVRVRGFIDTMPEAMAVSSLVVAKAGGLTVTEALGRGLPLILYYIIPGQERANAEHAARAGAAIIAHRPLAVGRAVTRLLAHPEELAAMQEAARALSRPDAADAIAERVVKPLLQTSRSPVRYQIPSGG